MTFRRKSCYPSVRPPHIRPSVRPPHIRPSVRPPHIRPSVRPPHIRPSVRPPHIRPSVRPSASYPSVRPPYIRPSVSAFYPNPSCFLVMILSASDLATGILATSTFAIYIGNELYFNVDCLTAFLNTIFSYLLIPTSFYTLLVLNVERYLSIIYPILYKSKVTKKKLLLSLGLLWLTCILALYLLFVRRPLAELYLAIAGIVGLTMLLGMYTKIFFIIRNRRKEMASLGLTRTTENEKIFLQNVREAWSCLIVAVCTIVCFLPSSIGVLARKMMYLSIIIHHWSTTIILTAPVLNSLVFFWRNKVWRAEAKKNTL